MGWLTRNKATALTIVACLFALMFVGFPRGNMFYLLKQNEAAVVVKYPLNEMIPEIDVDSVFIDPDMGAVMLYWDLAQGSFMNVLQPDVYYYHPGGYQDIMVYQNDGAVLETRFGKVFYHPPFPWAEHHIFSLDPVVIENATYPVAVPRQAFMGWLLNNYLYNETVGLYPAVKRRNATAYMGSANITWQVTDIQRFVQFYRLSEWEPEVVLRAMMEIALFWHTYNQFDLAFRQWGEDHPDRWIGLWAVSRDNYTKFWELHDEILAEIAEGLIPDPTRIEDTFANFTQSETFYAIFRYRLEYLGIEVLDVDIDYLSSIDFVVDLAVYEIIYSE